MLLKVLGRGVFFCCFTDYHLITHRSKFDWEVGVLILCRWRGCRVLYRPPVVTASFRIITDNARYIKNRNLKKQKRYGKPFLGLAVWYACGNQAAFFFFLPIR